MKESFIFHFAFFIGHFALASEPPTGLLGNVRGEIDEKQVNQRQNEK